MSWLNEINTANTRFRERITPASLPVEREPCPYAVITCMDPRVNIEAIGVPGFMPTGAMQSKVRVIRTIGGIHEDRSMIIGIHLAGFKEVAVLMHTDCGCCLAHSRIDTIIDNMEENLSPGELAEIHEMVGDPYQENLRGKLQAFEDPRIAVSNEVASIRQSPFVPESLIVHGLVYDLPSGAVEVIVDGYEASSKT